MKARYTSPKIGDIVSPNPDADLTYCNFEFQLWMAENKDRKFYVEAVYGPVVKLAKVHFRINERFLRESKNS